MTRAIGVGLPALGFALTLVIFGILLGRDSEERLEVSSLYEWIRAGDLSIDLAI